MLKWSQVSHVQLNFVLGPRWRCGCVCLSFLWRIFVTRSLFLGRLNVLCENPVFTCVTEVSGSANRKIPLKIWSYIRNMHNNFREVKCFVLGCLVLQLLIPLYGGVCSMLSTERALQTWQYVHVKLWHVSTILWLNHPAEQSPCYMWGTKLYCGSWLAVK